MSLTPAGTSIEESVAQYCASQFGSVIGADPHSTKRVDTSRLAEFGALHILALYQRHADVPENAVTP
jgi:hypothetical protein